MDLGLVIEESGLGASDLGARPWYLGTAIVDRGKGIGFLHLALGGSILDLGVVVGYSGMGTRELDLSIKVQASLSRTKAQTSRPQAQASVAWAREK